ncbi:2-oxoglutarate dehydrogenase E1 component [Virgibacillus profundi]|uniref:2-oxoglutarate dehydrogenase E1 component n=1 Tax=Virgibacillus profundi TaxID=2024555 RepID=A0A2A2IFE2_9BACI|nr:2-oxoglutarate dehydrogenase E1 component [Virgibacillus profundi]PAV29803.1 2-oxoglutarate dehydrogenase E1 component [Virgibacillus profundi]PXY53974.1 2-oxoglutarate dehydrogenase E1 component [Virgibacillus profundi]
MAQSEESIKRFWGEFHGPNMGYVEEQYDLYKEDPEAVDPSLKEMFDQYGAPEWTVQSGVQDQATSGQTSINDVKKLTSAMKLVEAIRRFGHLEADIYAVSVHKERKSNLVDPENYGLNDNDLKNMPASWLWENAPGNIENGLDVIKELKKYYSGTIAFEYDHVNNDEERTWLQQLIEAGEARMDLSDVEKKQLLERLAHVEGFEAFLQKTFVGQKRFSIEGLEAMVLMLDQVVKYAIDDKIENIMMGMAHRGRLSVLAHVLGKPYDRIFSEFQHSPDKELMPSEGSMGINYGWTGDVKYHFGATKDVKDGDETKTRITLAHNPSHLEFVNPVVEGFARAAQDNRSESGYPKQDTNKAIPVLIHGDAAFIGEGVVAETLNLSGLPGYKTGGSLHIIANNLVGYTTSQEDGRSTRYASDLAKGFEIPIIHVNADDPIACVSAVKIAYEYRQKFNKDFLIDLVGYRRYGHNEMDEPRSTQPKLYQDIDKHPTAANVFAKFLEEKGVMNADGFKKVLDDVENHLRDIFESMKENETGQAEVKNMPEALTNGISQFETAVELNALKALNKGLLNRPEGFNGFRKVEKILKRRENILEEGNKADWGAGEALAYASILQDGIPIRLTGQDTERGTFAHRHIVLHDIETNEKYSLMHGLEEAKASFDVRNSPLSEAGVLGFEYGYSVQSPNTLVIWEAQFGDFANAAQVVFDQFISAARAKWGEKSNMVMLLPHGYEGQGPEHSSARLERFLQMAAENNWIVAYPTSSAQFFHLIRRQAALRGREEARPLILMTPKSSLIRNPRIASTAKEFSEGKFEPLRQQPNLKVSKKNAKRLLIGSGKIMVDIEEAIDNSEEKFDWLRVLRLEQIYPFPKKDLEKELKELPNLEEIVWVQEEPKNMGSWDFVDDYLRDLLQDGQTLRYIGRPDRSSPAVGVPNVHKTEQSQLVQKAINPSKGGDSSERN